MIRRSDGQSVDKVTVLVTGKIHDESLKTLAQPPEDLKLPVPIEVINRPDCSREELLKLVASADVLLTRSETTVDADVIDAAPHLSVIARAAVGYGNIDVNHATKQGMLVVNTPGKNTNSAAELTLGLLLNMARKIPEADETMKHGGWDRHRFTGVELMGKKIGIVGLGNVGHRVAKFCNGLDMDVYAYDPYIAAEVFRRNKATQCPTLGELLEQVDILSVHVPLNSETKAMVGASELAKLRAGAWVINAARGGVIVETDLLAALESGQIACGGIDTWEDEPEPMAALVKHPRVVATPHIGASTYEAQKKIGQTVVVQILKALRGEIVDYPVNLPNLSVLPTQIDRNRSVLLEKLGRMLAQLQEFRPESLVLRLPSDIDPKLHELLSISAIKGYLSHSSDDFVSYVNARLLFEGRGLSLSVETSEAGRGIRAEREIQLEVRGSAAKESLLLGAQLYEGVIPRITRIDDFEFESEPAGDLIVLTNEDRPGVIGNVGAFLAARGVNIAQFDLSRNQTGGQAMAIIRVDSAVPAPELGKMMELPNVLKVKAISGI